MPDPTPNLRVPTDIEIAQSAQLRPIGELARDRLGIGADFLETYGRHKAKVALRFIDTLQRRRSGKLVLVTAISPTPAGEGKTTTSVGLADGLARIGAKALLCLREPSLGPVFGLKGGAAGGGHAQVVPMEDINLHFTGDFHAIAAAHNLLAAMLDNHVYHGNALGIDVRRVTWKRVLDANDRALRQITVGLGGPANGFPREDGFDIVAASEVMAILCLATDLADLKQRLGNIVVGYSFDRGVVRARDLRAHGAMAALLRDALAPNLVQTLENNPAFVHGGPFANIAHGCNSVLATRAALKLADYVVTEAGFGADLGAEKFLDIKCRKAGIWPAAAVVVATLRAIKFQGGAPLEQLDTTDTGAIDRGCENLERHIENMRGLFGLPCVVALNHRSSDGAAELAHLAARVAALGVRFVVARHWAEGGAGAEELAREVVRMCSSLPPPQPQYAYADKLPLWEKARAVATRVYGAADITADAGALAQLRRIEDSGYGDLPVCIAKTQYSFSTDPARLGAPTGHVVNIREARLAAGAGFVVLVCGEIRTMPGLPKEPTAFAIDVDGDGHIIGLS
ncbi:MAG TPA: formate--tetrahydrofolate ligase [Burkholderiaceae bacterium]|nr:formate--tetrahydrofolate ligase [Burkholderiaceae bacterium]